MLGQTTPVKSFPSHAISDPKIVDMRADRQLMTQKHYYHYYYYPPIDFFPTYVTTWWRGQNTYLLYENIYCLRRLRVTTMLLKL